VGLLSDDIELEARVNTVHADISVLKIVLTGTCTMKSKVKNNDQCTRLNAKCYSGVSWAGNRYVSI
jgi:hypothetical protein